MIETLLYLGPNGSYSDLAKNSFIKYFSDNCEFIKKDSIFDVIEELIEANDVKAGAVLPIENSIEGCVNETQDDLLVLAKNKYYIFAETNININHCLVSYGDKSQIKTIISHPQALAQCRNYIHKNFKNNVYLMPKLSTSLAISELSQDDLSIAAIGSKYCANLFNVPIIEETINDEKNNKTRFVLLSKETPNDISNNKISIVFSTKNESGALNKILSIIEKYGLNMTHINSRPSKKELGEYLFYVDIEGYIEQNNIKQAIVEIESSALLFKIISKGALLI